MQAALAAAAADYERHTKDAQKVTTAPPKKQPRAEPLDLDGASSAANEAQAGGSGKRKVNPARFSSIISLIFPRNDLTADIRSPCHCLLDW